ncbi:DUF2946 domain-containing protein [Paramixta manurensis]|uniref:DUF2946 domain-containing protein n=1 Tax=Paramixta manurensis TaxID=2740817 RepID=A0A6M8UDD8_9GAMM|nr:DUF2946 domain-containing protein [Erwiniaceae bacterium PD-1]
MPPFWRQAFQYLRSGRRRLSVFLVALCWLALNAQLALAAHRCEMLPLPGAMAQHHASYHYTSTPHSLKPPSPICEKHCTADPWQNDNGHVKIDTLPVVTTLIIQPPAQQIAVASPCWLMPPASGPPAEIRFCRFRE